MNKENRVWARLGGYISFTKEEAEKIQKLGYIETSLMTKIIQDGRIRLDGDSYIPDDSSAVISVGSKQHYIGGYSFNI
jgi:hypothetical protein